MFLYSKDGGLAGWTRPETSLCEQPDKLLPGEWYIIPNDSWHQCWPGVVQCISHSGTASKWRQHFLWVKISHRYIVIRATCSDKCCAAGQQQRHRWLRHRYRQVRATFVWNNKLIKVMLGAIAKVCRSPVKRTKLVSFETPPSPLKKFALQASTLRPKCIKTPFDPKVWFFQKLHPPKRILFVWLGFCELLRCPLSLHIFEKVRDEETLVLEKLKWLQCSLQGAILRQSWRFLLCMRLTHNNRMEWVCDNLSLFFRCTQFWGDIAVYWILAGCWTSNPSR